MFIVRRGELTKTAHEVKIDTAGRRIVYLFIKYKLHTIRITYTR